MTSVKRDGLAIIGAAKAKLGMAPTDIIDIRREHVEMDLQKEVERMMNPAEGPKTLPTLLLYDEKGLQLFEDVSFSHIHGGTIGCDANTFWLHRSRTLTNTTSPTARLMFCVAMPPTWPARSPMVPLLWSSGAGSSSLLLFLFCVLDF